MNNSCYQELSCSAPNISTLSILYKKVKLSLQQAMKAHRVVKRRGTHIF
jgi:hypothetical protein